METVRVWFGALCLAASLGAQVEDKQVVTRRFPLAAGAAPEIVVTVITGGIRVTAHAVNEVALTATTHYEAPDAAALAEQKKQIRFESEQSGNNIWIGIEGDGYRDRGWSRPRELGWRGKSPAGKTGPAERRWRFRHDIDLKVPREAHLKLSTVNGGSIEVDGVSGEFHLNNVNGGIDVKHAGGFGRAHTVNGPVTMAFDKNPSGPTSVKTINGEVHLYFEKNLNADFKIKTFNGKIYSDFAMLARTGAATKAEDRGLKRIWRTSGFSTARVGGGGPEIELDGFNGDIHILERKN
jgi:hypothetical protein